LKKFISTNFTSSSGQITIHHTGGATNGPSSVFPDLLPQEVGMSSQINVPPVTGMTPAQIASELRVLIRDQIWSGLTGIKKHKSPGQNQYLTAVGTYLNSAAAYMERVTESRQTVRSLYVEVANDLAELRDISKKRKPSETATKIDAMFQPESGSMYKLRQARNIPGVRDLEITLSRAHTNYKAAQDHGFGSQNIPPEIMAHAERAYALVQALPTVDNPTIGKADNTLRAITSMVKVYWGVDVEGGPDKLPNVLGELLKGLERMAELETAVKKQLDEATKANKAAQAASEQAQQYKQEAIDQALFEQAAKKKPKTSINFNPMPLKTINLPLGPFTIWSPNMQLDTTMITTQHEPNGAYSHMDNGPGDMSQWSHGNCTYDQAVRTLAWVRAHYNDPYFDLRGPNSLILARAKLQRPIDFHSGPKIPLTLAQAQSMDWVNDPMVPSAVMHVSQEEAAKMFDGISQTMSMPEAVTSAALAEALEDINDEDEESEEA
jgi:hypothetical protein